MFSIAVSCGYIVRALSVFVSSCLRLSRVRRAPRRPSPACSTCPTDRVRSTRLRPPPLPRLPLPPRLSAWASWSAVSVRTRLTKTQHVHKDMGKESKEPQWFYSKNISLFFFFFYLKPLFQTNTYERFTLKQLLLTDLLEKCGMFLKSLPMIQCSRGASWKCLRFVLNKSEAKPLIEKDNKTLTL